MSRRRLIAVVLVAALLVGLVLRAEQRAAADRLVERAIEVAGRTFRRASHHPEPGKFGERLHPVLWHEREPAWVPGCIDVAAGAAPLASLTSECEGVWQREREWAKQVFQSSRAEEWSRVPWLHAFERGPGSITDREPALLFAFRVGALEIRKAASEDGARLCVDGIALARDQSALGGLRGAIVAAAGQHDLASPCAEALAAASPATRAWARRALEAIQRSWPSASDWMAFEVASATFRVGLTEAQSARLPAGCCGLPYFVASTLPEHLLLERSLPWGVRMLERIEAASRLAPAQRDAAMRDLETSQASSWFRVRRAALPSYSTFFKRDDDRREELRRLIASLPPAE